MSAIPNSTISGLALVGWKMGELLPYLSPAMTSGGVSKNLFKDMAALRYHAAAGSAMTSGGVSENLFKDMIKEMPGGGDPMATLLRRHAASGSAHQRGHRVHERQTRGESLQ
ncbi:hypothetical protein B0I35DRAFT_403520 [Stachybotrys elegans]|uniref:Uncharacterized protein n=1 Tax=Stachybotrys elegans TaxID=80388 RepID=A0A8K0WVY1_9HYPO|nr:hypothetical protein B0I35DRAFT_403520 [Stachybotrys elegans]